jgi:hypothetical protein
LTVERLPEGKMRFTSISWDHERMFAGNQVLEVHWVDGSLHVARKERHHDEWDPPIEPGVIFIARPQPTRSLGRTDNTSGVLADLALQAITEWQRLSAGGKRSRISIIRGYWTSPNAWFGSSECIFARPLEPSAFTIMLTGRTLRCVLLTALGIDGDEPV